VVRSQARSPIYPSWQRETSGCERVELLASVGCGEKSASSGWSIWEEKRMMRGQIDGRQEGEVGREERVGFDCFG
jgi:hypothetical protein